MSRVLSVHSADEFQAKINAKAPFGGATGAGFALSVQVDVDECSDVASKCGITGMPTFHSYLNGSKVDQVVGADKAKLSALVEGLAQHVASSSSAGEGRKLGGPDVPLAGTGADDPDARRARMAAAAEARFKAMQG
ncbi:hypothetical protein QJQ45_029140 [Haematococcus lacustris]|nr:hypothetical protein QJQ45_029140 [Haematococcus lacustris]